MTEIANRVQYVVNHIDWTQVDYDGGDFIRRAPRTEPVASFATFDEVDTERRVREAEARVEWMPVPERKW